MMNNTNSRFGNLTLKQKKLHDIAAILNKDKAVIDSLFQDNNSKLDELTVLDAERRIAIENLRELTTTLQTKRLREKAKSSCKYFTL